MRDDKNACRRQDGMAVLVAILALSLVSLVAFHLALIATTEVRIGDNHESLIRARAAAMAGLAHGRELLRGLNFSDLLAGPDGMYSNDLRSLDRARSYACRLPVEWAVARMLDPADPSGLPAGLPDDGLINTGAYPGGNGLVLIPATGILLSLPNPWQAGTGLLSRYFVKVTDNNGEATELAGDPANNPFVDGDGRIILRSMGIARTLAEATQTGLRRNSVAVFEARFQRLFTFDLDAPLVVRGSTIESESPEMFAGSQFLIQGGASNPGLGVIDSDSGDNAAPASQIANRLTAAQAGLIQGAGLTPSIRDITAMAASHPEKSALLNEGSTCELIKSLAQFADAAFTGNQDWQAPPAISLGHFDANLPPTMPGQNLRATFVAGDLRVAGDIEGGGLLVVTGKMTIAGRFSFSGLILVIGAGELDLGGAAIINGGMYVAKNACFPNGCGNVRLTVRDNARILFHRAAIRAALNLFPPRQLGFREITAIIDPANPP